MPVVSFFPQESIFVSVNREEAWPHPKRKFTQSTTIHFCGLPFVIPISPNEKKYILLGSFAQRSQVAPSILHVLWDQQLWMPFEARVFLILDSWEKNDMMKLPWHFWMQDRFLFFGGSPFMVGYSLTAWTLYQSWRVQDVTTILLEDCKICGSCSLSEAVLLVWPVDLFSLIKVCWSFVVRKAIHKFWFATKQGHLLELYTQLAVTSFDRISVCAQYVTIISSIIIIVRHVIFHIQNIYIYMYIL